MDRNTKPGRKVNHCRHYILGDHNLSHCSFFVKRKMKETITDASHLIRDLRKNKTENTDIFPKEYSEITAQMLKIRADMQEHERLLKEKTDRKNDLITYFDSRI